MRQLDTAVDATLMYTQLSLSRMQEAEWNQVGLLTIVAERAGVAAVLQQHMRHLDPAVNATLSFQSVHTKLPVDAPFCSP
jgi:hypothetical protein